MFAVTLISLLPFGPLRGDLLENQALVLVLALLQRDKTGAERPCGSAGVVLLIRRERRTSLSCNC